MPLRHLEIARAKHRRESEGHKQRHQHPEGDHHRERFEELAEDTADENHRGEDGHQTQGGGDHREHHFPAAVDGRRRGVGIQVFPVSEDVLQHHDGVVHHHTDQQQQGQHGDGIEGVAEKVHHRHRSQQRHRYGRGDDEGGTHRAQEQPHHERSEQCALDQMLLQGVHDLLDEQSVVAHDAEGHPGRQLGNDFPVEAALYLVDDGDGISVGHLHHANTDGGLAVEAGELTEIRQAVLDPAEIPEPDRRAVAVGHDHFFQLIQPMKFQVELHQVLGLSAREEAAGELQVLLVEGVRDVLGGDAERGHFPRHQVYPDGAVATAAKAHFAHAVDGLQTFLDHVERVLVELLLGAVALQGEPHDGIGVGLELGDHRGIGVIRQAPQHLVYLGLDLVEADVDALVQAEGDVHHRRSGGRGGLDMLDAGDAVDRGLDQVGDGRVHDVGIGPLHGGGDRYDGKLDKGKTVDADTQEADNAE